MKKLFYTTATFRDGAGFSVGVFQSPRPNGTDILIEKVGPFATQMEADRIGPEIAKRIRRAAAKNKIPIFELKK